MQHIEGGVCAPKGFKATSTAANIKYENRDDMALIYSDTVCKVAGTFTRNVVKAAPIIWDRNIVNHNIGVQAVVVNSGIANACTGDDGIAMCIKTAQAVSSALHIPYEGVLVASTGVIGMPIPLDKIKNGIDDMAHKLSYDNEAGTRAAKAIMTTDTISKEVAVSVTIAGKEVIIGGMSKGSGMIHPDMCTMLAFVMTDVEITDEMLKKALHIVVEDTYNMISVDGDTSTNDTCLLLANGKAGNDIIDSEGDDFDAFVEALMEVNRELAKMMAGDGEGANALFEVKVVGSDNVENAKKLAKSVVTSSLTKAAIYGHDANWGRILCALGYAGVEFNPERVDLYFESKVGKLKIVSNGVATDYSEDEATKILSQDAVTAICNMHMGDASATAWGCDLSHEYVSINADYRS
ncbi:MAG: bifunctional glutamate N-acetyltransferase/amino-acid acetyltransferase ArgJ [Lachnospiraceae bacterium]|nr:bifunctional glutamate N-acetyltransferase/amino-acid acetyltransferase ArgJ [Lachnospiraceae bacterium]